MIRPGRVFVLGLGLLALAAILLRVIAARALTEAGAPGLVLDAAAYDRWARALAAGTPPVPSAFHLAPLYPTLAGIVYRFAGDGSAAMTQLQHLAALGLLLLTGFLAARLGGGFRQWPGVATGLLAGALVAGSRSLVAYEQALLPEILGASLLLLGVGGLAHAAEHRPFPIAVALGSGLALGLDALVRPSGLLVGLALAAWIWARDGRRGARPAAALLLGVTLAVLPVTLRNRIVGGEWVFVTASGGFNFYIGNHPGADGGYVQPAGVRFVPGDAGDPTGRAPAEAAAGRTLSAGQVSRYWRDRGLEFWHRTPIAATRLFARKVALTWTRAEIPQIMHVRALARDVPRFGRLPLTGPELLQPLALLGVAFAVAGAAGRGPWRGRPGISLVALALGAFSVATALFFVTDRFRIQTIPLLSVMAALGVVGCGTSVRDAIGSKRGRPVALALGLAGVSWIGTWPRLLGVGGTLGDPWLEPMNRALTLAQADGDSAAIAAAFADALARGPDVARIYVNRGEWLRRAGDLPAARADLTRAVTLDPGDPVAWTALAATQVALSDPAAFASYDRARTLDPSYLPAALGRGQLLLMAERPADARRDLEAALAGPDSAAAHDALGVAVALLGDRRAGLRHIARAVELEPRRPLYLLHLGLAAAENGEPLAAEGAIVAALGLDPGYRPARLALATLYRDRGDRARAQAQVDSLLVLYPNDPAALGLAAELGSAR